MLRGEIWFAETSSGDRPVLVLTRDPVAARIGGVVAAEITQTIRGIASELALTAEDGVPVECVVSFDNINTLPRSAFRRRVAKISPARMTQACQALKAATGC